MVVHHISITEAKQNLGELVKRTAYGGERFILEFRGKPQAVLVSCEDLEQILRLEGAPGPGSQREALERLRQLRKRIAARTGEVFDSARELERIRQERVDELLAKTGHVDLDEEAVLTDLDALRDEIAAQSGELPDSAQVLDELRQERLNELLGLH